MYAKYAKLRDSKGLTDYRVASDTGISPNTISDWKNNKCSPSFKNIEILSDYFDVSLDYWKTGKEE